MKFKYQYKALIMTLLITMFFTVFSCSHEDSEDDKVPIPENKVGLIDPSTITNINNVTPNTYTTEDITNTMPDTNPPSYNLIQAQSFMHWLNPTDTCSIGWDITPYKKLRSEACGIESKQRECNSCHHPTFGKSGETTYSKYFTVRDYPLKNIPYKEYTYVYDICASHAKEISDSINSTTPKGKSVYVNFSSGYFIDTKTIMTHRRLPESIQVICYYQIEIKTPVYFEGKSCELCGGEDKIIYKSCRHPSHGLEETVSKSSNTLSKQEVEKSEGKVLGCKTCDDIKFDILNMDEENDTQLVNRINCLLNNLDSNDINNEDKQGIITELKRLTIYSDLINKNHPDLFIKVKEHI